MQNIVIPIIYGTEAIPLKRPDSDHTHKWRVYLKCASTDLRIEQHVSSVTFKLHESFPTPNRVVSEPPYEVGESGWGEFVIGIRVSFRNSALRPISFSHPLRLHPAMEEDSLKSKSVISETFDEIVVLAEGGAEEAAYTLDPLGELLAPHVLVKEMVEKERNIIASATELFQRMIEAEK